MNSQQFKQQKLKDYYDENVKSEETSTAKTNEAGTKKKKKVVANRFSKAYDQYYEELKTKSKK